MGVAGVGQPPRGGQAAVQAAALAVAASMQGITLGEYLGFLAIP